jgi:hypothetical protein
MTSDRRDFLLRALAGAAGLAVTDASALGAAPLRAADDEAWLKAYEGKKHKVLMDVMEFFPDETPFRRAKTLLRVMRESYGAHEGDVALTVGMHGRGLAHLVATSVWTDLGLTAWLAPQLNSAAGAGMKAMEVSDGTFGTISNYALMNRDSVKELRDLGVHFVACRETIARWAQRKATQSGESVEIVTARIIHGLHDGVETVPAMIAASVLAQEAGARYVAVA